MCDIKETRHLWYLKNRERLIEHQKTYRIASDQFISTII